MIKLEAQIERNKWPALLKQEQETRLALENTLWQEAVMWLQKSNLQRTLEGDSNTSFFHATTLRRCCRNRIRCFKDDTGEWITNPEELARLARNFFMDLFGAATMINDSLDVPLF